MSEQEERGIVRGFIGAIHNRCSRCPHGSTMHTITGACLFPECPCPGFEPDPIPPQQETIESDEGQVIPTRMKPTEEELAEHRYRNVVPNQSVPVPVLDQKGVTKTPVNLEKSEVLRTSHKGGHYHDFAIEPLQYIEANNLDFHQGNIVKYVSRWRLKDGLDDLKKALFYLNRYIEINEVDA